MKNLIRWRGLVAFVGFFTIIILIGYLFIAPILRFALTSGLTRANGAEVNISEVKVNWSPFALELVDIQFTDPETPELNRFQADQVGFSMELLPAIMGRIYIEELVADGIVMGVERARPGRVRADYLAEREAEGETMTWGERFSELGFDFPDLDEILGRSDIQTPQIVEDVTRRSQASRDRVESSQEQLPDSDVIENYEERVRELRQARPSSIEEFEQLRTQLSELRDDMRADRDRVLAFKVSVEEAYEQVAGDVTRLREAPGADIRRMQQLMELDNEAIADIAGILFGPQIQQWTDYVLVAYDFVAPMLQSEAEEEPTRWEGRFIEFDDGDQASFLVRLARTSFTFSDIDVAMVWNDITWQHERIGSPTTYVLNVSESPYWQSLSADGNFFINEATEFQGQQTWALQGAELAAQTLLEQNNIRVNLSQATLNSSGDISINQGQFSGGGALNMQSISLDTSGDRTWARLLAQALQEISQFDMDVGLAGRIGSPRLSINSDLDNQLTGALSGVMQDYASEQLVEVRAQLEAEVASALADVQPQLDQINQLRSLASEREGSLEDLLAQELDNLRDNALDQIRDRLGDSIRDRFGNNE